MHSNFARQGIILADVELNRVISDGYNAAGTAAQNDIANGILPGASNNPDGNFIRPSVLQEYHMAGPQMKDGQCSS